VMSTSNVAEIICGVARRRATVRVHQKYCHDMLRAACRSASSCGVTVFFILLV
jgi:hypothetical protein